MFTTPLQLYASTDYFVYLSHNLNANIPNMTGKKITEGGILRVREIKGANPWIRSEEVCNNEPMDRKKLETILKSNQHSFYVSDVHI